jgi:uncharacterized membrane protein YccC
MKNSAYWNRLRAAITAHRVQLRFSLRMTTAGLAALLVTQILSLPLHGLWVVLTAVVVTQMSVGGSLRATIEYIVGTLGGAVYAGIIGLLAPHTAITAQAIVLALTIGPLAFAAALNPNFRVAPFSAVLVLLLAGQLDEGPVESAVTRFWEVALGGAIAIAASLLVFPERAHNLGADAAARILDQMAEVLPELLAGFTSQLDPKEIGRIQDDIGQAVIAFQDITAEAKREHLINLTSGPDPAPLSRTLLRLRHDFVIIGRATTPLPDALIGRLGPLLDEIGADASDFLRDGATALRLRRPPSPLHAIEASLKNYDTAVALLRKEGLTHPLTIEELERVFSVGFAVEQLHRDFIDLARCIQEYAPSGGAGRVS